ncbi:SDR family NAD(P)-dependent oxidoreductase [Cyanobium sp. ATX 6A2]|uniref:SDR family NAD(P)-dependent oxidoreductase n=1 Tax=Cyanobium sp. ATX 6A2 TaxID=2823700 RepID=UPI0020CFC37B|nr:SDR family NAD(P)-dependent oxidoreductase [Cyanobium sp. ATX 6A2]MCP9888505.1 SDR family NAD(P)-dependent oxidoreductase [Cyanobium sp. ATX 6A2]
MSATPGKPEPADAPSPRTVLVSGASRGIGRAIAGRLLAEGHRVSAGVRDPAGLQAETGAAALCRQPPERLLIHPYEAGAGDADPRGPRAWVDATVARWGGIDALVHCAGVFSRVGLRFAAGEEAEIARVLDVNLMGPWRLSRAVWPLLAASGDGRVLTLVSMSGKRVKGRLAAYGVSKFALLALCQAMRNEGWEDGIRVTAICPSWVNTDMAAAVTAIPSQAMTQPEDLAASVSHLLSLPAAAVPFEFNVNCQLET